MYKIKGELWGNDIMASLFCTQMSIFHKGFFFLNTTFSYLFKVKTPGPNRIFWLFIILLLFLNPSYCTRYSVYVVHSQCLIPKRSTKKRSCSYTGSSLFNRLPITVQQRHCSFSISKYNPVVDPQVQHHLTDFSSPHSVMFYLFYC